ncbi:MAG: hypothetical protein B7X41_03715 [Microbacterium sp. 14-71-5]|nr:MAG: hypothetical protein B7X41_03715 [Microbacterium sp. 14-71-5]
MVSIELDDEAHGAPPEHRRTVSRGTRPWWVVGAATAVLALVLGQWVADLRSHAGWQRLADRTDVVRPVGRSVTPRWSLDPSQLATISQGLRWRGTVVGPVDLPDGSVVLASVDGRDGHRRWTTPVLGPDPQRAQAGSSLRPAGACERQPDDPSRVVCLVSDAVVVGGEHSVTAHAPTSEVHLVVVDPETGRTRADHRVGTDLGTLYALLPGGLAVLGSSRSSSDVVAVDAASGAERWRVAAPPAARGAGFGVAAVGDAVAVIGDTGLVVLGRDGTVRRTERVTGFQGYLPAGDGRIAVPGSTGTLVVGADRDLQLVGAALCVAADDGSVPGLTLTRSDALHAYGADGRPWWQLTGSSPTGAVVLHGVVYLTRDGGVVAVDGVTGKVVWQVSLPVQPLSPMRDGRVLLVALSTDVAALDPRTGAELWRSPLPSGGTTLVAFGGLLLATTKDGPGTVVLG